MARLYTVWGRLGRSVHGVSETVPEQDMGASTTAVKLHLSQLHCTNLQKTSSGAIVTNHASQG